ncbi:MAG: methionyl-tRNA formyltransferase, partial [Deltaproteobacteria bacterium]|nr:methionyl-tRNA formyltransferase [Deltaproteobacteria bacterium]
MRVVFMGTSLFAVPSLKALLDDAGIEVILVATQPDRPKGRGRIVGETPVKGLALGHNLPVLQPEQLKEEGFIEVLKALVPDFIVVVAYGKILHRVILDIPRHGCVNLHASLLPAYRGAAPINWAIIKGEEKTGVTTMLMDEGMDTGPMLLKDEVRIGERETALGLSERLSVEGAVLLVKTLQLLYSGKITALPQDSAFASYAPILKKQDGRIDWTKSAMDIDRLVRGMHPWPSAYTSLYERVVKVVSGMPLAYAEDIAGARSGEVIDITDKGIKVMTGKGVFGI